MCIRDRCVCVGGGGVRERYFNTFFYLKGVQHRCRTRHKKSVQLRPRNIFLVCTNMEKIWKDPPRLRSGSVVIQIPHMEGWSALWTLTRGNKIVKKKRKAS